MEEKRSNIFNLTLIIGLIIIIAGVLALLKNLDYDIPINIWAFWPVIIIAIGLSKLIQPREYRNTIGASVLLIIGVLFLLNNLDIIRFGFRELWPIILILVGLLIIKHGFWSSRSAAVGKDYINLSFILGGGDFNFTSRQIRGGNVIAIMGGGTLNLKEADMHGDAITIDIFTLMGGVDIIVPDSWQVTMQGIPILGGMENKTTSGFHGESTTSPTYTNKQLVIKGMAIMGGVEVKN